MQMQYTNQYADLRSNYKSYAIITQISYANLRKHNTQINTQINYADSAIITQICYADLRKCNTQMNT